MVLALLTVAIAFVVGLTFMASSTTAVGTASVMSGHAQSRQIAESGLGVAISYLERTPEWRTSQPQGEWIHDFALLGGTLTVAAAFLPEIAPGALTPADASFEMQTAALPTPLLAPPMSGTVGGWQVRRSAVVATGPTVPTIGTQATPNATVGVNAAFVAFGVAVTGTGTLSQALSQPLAPLTSYELRVDVTVTTGLSNLTHAFRILAGSTVVASSEHAWTLTLPSQPPTPPQNPADPAEYQALLTYAGLGPGVPTTYALTFVTDNDPPSGNISIEMEAGATGLAASVWFDNVRFVGRRNSPVTITATGKCGSASHIVTAQVVKTFDGSAKILDWREP